MKEIQKTQSIETKSNKELLKKGGDTRSQLNKLGADVTKSNNKLVFDNEKLKTISSREFLKISEKERLKYVTKNNIDSETILLSSIKNLEFSFDQDGDGKINKELYMLTTAGQVLPKEIRELRSGGQKYNRIGINGEFYSGEKRLIIHDKTQISIDKIGSSEDLNTIEKNNLELYNLFIEKNPEYREEKYYKTLNETFSKGIQKENEIMFLLTLNTKNLEKSSSFDLNKLLVISKYLKNGGFLDNYTDAGELVSKLEDIINTINKYASGLKYSVGNDGNLKFNLDSKGLPEGLDINPSLEKFTKIALSQLGISEKDGGADKYLKDLGYTNLDSRSTPWCGAFINRTLKQSGYKGTGGLSAKEFIGESGYGHAGIKFGDKVLGGNQGNKVSLININKTITGYALATKNGLEIHNPTGDINNIPDGAIIVFDRNTKKDINLS